jgi:hypothetical protein
LQYNAYSILCQSSYGVIISIASYNTVFTHLPHLYVVRKLYVLQLHVRRRRRWSVFQITSGAAVRRLTDKASGEVAASERGSLGDAHQPLMLLSMFVLLDKARLNGLVKRVELQVL